MSNIYRELCKLFDAGNSSLKWASFRICEQILYIQFRVFIYSYCTLFLLNTHSYIFT